MKKQQEKWSKLKVAYTKKIKSLEAQVAKLQASHKTIKAAVTTIAKQFSASTVSKTRKKTAKVSAWRSAKSTSSKRPSKKVTSLRQKSTAKRSSAKSSARRSASRTSKRAA